MILFQSNLEIAAESEEELRDLIVDALVHETAHFWGIHEDELIDQTAVLIRTPPPHLCTSMLSSSIPDQSCRMVLLIDGSGR